MVECQEDFTLGDGGILKATGVGRTPVLVPTTGGSRVPVELQRVLIVPGLTRKILSVRTSTGPEEPWSLLKEEDSSVSTTTTFLLAVRRACTRSGSGLGSLVLRVDLRWPSAEARAPRSPRSGGPGSQGPGEYPSQWGPVVGVLRWPQLQWGPRPSRVLLCLGAVEVIAEPALEVPLVATAGLWWARTASLFVLVLVVELAPIML